MIFISCNSKPTQEQGNNDTNDLKPNVDSIITTQTQLEEPIKKKEPKEKKASLDDLVPTDIDTLNNNGFRLFYEAKQVNAESFSKPRGIIIALHKSAIGPDELKLISYKHDYVKRGLTDGMEEDTMEQISIENHEDHYIAFLESKDTIFKPGILPKVNFKGEAPELLNNGGYIPVPTKNDTNWFSIEGGHDYMIVLLTEVTYSDGGPYQRLKVIYDLTDGLESRKFSGIHWLGDLDRDGRVDVIENKASEIFEIYNVELHLSNPDTTGSMLKTVAKVRRTSC